VDGAAVCGQPPLAVIGVQSFDLFNFGSHARPWAIGVTQHDCALRVNREYAIDGGDECVEVAPAEKVGFDGPGLTEVGASIEAKVRRVIFDSILFESQIGVSAGEKTVCVGRHGHEVVLFGSD